jgi:hypothetical protein
VEAVHALDLVAAILRHAEAIAHDDAPDHEHLVLELDLTDRLDLIALRIDFDLTRFQRAGEGAGQSPAGRGYDVVERGGVRRVLLGGDAVVRGDLGVHAERDRLGLGGKVREPLRSAETLDPDSRDVRRHAATVPHSRSPYAAPLKGV